MPYIKCMMEDAYKPLDIGQKVCQCVIRLNQGFRVQYLDIKKLHYLKYSNLIAVCREARYRLGAYKKMCRR